MRPKRRVLIVDADENRLSVLRFTLEVNGYAIRGVSSAASALNQITEWEPELAIVAMPLISINLGKLLLSSQRSVRS